MLAIALPPRRVAFPAALALIAVVSVVDRASAQAQPKVAAKAVSEIIDDAGMFSDAALRRGKEALARVDRAFGIAVTVETVASLRGQAIDEFAIRRAEQLDHKGVFILIAKADRKAEALASPKALRDELGASRLHSIRDAFTAEFREGRVDEGLLKGIQAASTALGAIRPDRGGVVAALETASGGLSSPLIARQQVRLTLAGARKAMAGAESRAAEKGYRMNLAVVDDGGHLVAFARMDGARPASVATATTKAVSAATFRAATGPLPPQDGKVPDLLMNLALQGAAADSGGKITSLPGGIPIVVDGQVIGAIGVAGGSGDQDSEVAQAGIAAFMSGLKEGPEVAAPRSDKIEGDRPAVNP